ncbi:MAG: HAD hydrolase-like protein [candidate division WOR-3 bacterium]|nr:MAG: HAD hydrolase-like protein [candidate division WOR-3 bacterium]
MLPHSIKLVLFDLVGTIVKDCSEGPSIIVQSMTDAFAANGINVSAKYVKEQRGKEKRKAIEEILRGHVKPDTAHFKKLTANVYERFLTALRTRVNDFTPMEKVTDVFRFLKKRGIYVGVGSGLPVEILDMLVVHLGWKKAHLIDYVQSAETIGTGRPDPKMIHDMMAEFGVVDPRNVVKVGDTMVDILEGKNAHVWTVAVLSGTQSEDELKSVKPDFMVAKVHDLPQLFSE